jgi:transcription elongation factor GreA
MALDDFDPSQFELHGVQINDDLQRQIDMLPQGGSIHYLTPAGKVALEKRIVEKQAELDSAMGGIGESTQGGGETWHDNASYDYYTAEVRRLAGELERLKDIARFSVLVDSIERNQDIVGLGSIVELKEPGIEESAFTVQILGKGEGSPHTGQISYESPVARAIMGKKVGDVVTVKGDGIESFKIEVVSVKNTDMINKNTSES